MVSGAAEGVRCAVVIQRVVPAHPGGKKADFRALKEIRHALQQSYRLNVLDNVDNT